MELLGTGSSTITHRPRLTPVVAGFGERFIGGIALMLLALALIELDGLMAICGYLASLAAIAWLAAVVLGLGKIATTVFA